MAVRCFSRGNWSVDHRPTGYRVCIARTRAEARSIARILASTAGPGLASTDHDTVVRAVVASPAFAVIARDFAQWALNRRNRDCPATLADYTADQRGVA